MEELKNVLPLEKPLDKFQTPTMIDINSNMRQEQVSFGVEEKPILMWVFDIYRFHDMDEYNKWEVEKSREAIKVTEKAIGEIMVMQADFEAMMMEAVAELSIMITGGEM